MIKRRLLSLVLGILATISIVIILEWVFGQILLQKGPLYWNKFHQSKRRQEMTIGNSQVGIFPESPPIKRETAPEFKYIPDEYITNKYIPKTYLSNIDGSILRLPATSYRHIKQIEGSEQIIYDIQFSIDRFHRRETYSEKNKNNTSEFVALLGDSFIFGQGVAENETLAAHLGARLSTKRVYNYGIAGLFPGQLLDWMRFVAQHPEQITEKKGTALYFYADYHIGRTLAALKQIGRWGYRQPYYFEDRDGKIRAKESIEDAMPLWVKFARISQYSNILRYFHFDWPLRPSEDDWLFFIKLLKSIEAEMRQFGTDRFYVVIYPQKKSGRIIPFLEKAQIPYIDLSQWNIDMMTEGPSRIPYDWHHTSEVYQIIAKTLADVLDKKQ